MSTLNGVVFAIVSVPSSHVFVALSESDITEAEPQEEAADGEPVLRRDQEGVHDQKASKKVHAEQ